MLRNALAVLVLAIVPQAASAADLAKVDRRLTPPTKWSGAEQFYGLFVFGTDAAARAWMVIDGEVPWLAHVVAAPHPFLSGDSGESRKRPLENAATLTERRRYRPRASSTNLASSPSRLNRSGKTRPKTRSEQTADCAVDLRARTFAVVPGTR